ncbi:peroxisome assembly factor 2-like [Centruroides sculpturatus]|uniref:peroxisome assembly factor 2-like n=1 Tax=Centruroides sculpturatus TaxID=218467 RepID=UPI000C6DD5EE|nr:peroxisome assembly factor 2-like [Centruroides sculpturatus]
MQYYTGTVQSYVPVTMDVYYSPNPIHPIWEIPKPPGMDLYVDQLQSIIMPYLKLDSIKDNTEFGDVDYQIRPNILLTGPSGYGKTIIVKSLCRCLNLHFFQVNCYNLIGDLPGATEARFKATFEKAIMCAPCILLLKNIEIIRRDDNFLDDSVLIANVGECTGLIIFASSHLTTEPSACAICNSIVVFDPLLTLYLCSLNLTPKFGVTNRNLGIDHSNGNSRELISSRIRDIVNACEKAILIKRKHIRKVPWWNAELTEMHQQNNWLRRRF